MSHKSHIRAPRPSILARRIRPITLLLAVTGFTATTGWAADATWDGPAGTQPWSLDTNWNPDLAPGATSGTTNGDTATFNTNLGATSITIDAGRNVKTLNFASGAGGFTIGTTANAGEALNLSSGGNITLQTGVATTITINSPLVLQPASNTTAGAYTLSNLLGVATVAATPKLNVAGNISGGATSAAVTLTLAGNVGSRLASAAQAPQLANTISGVISNGDAASLGVTVNGTSSAADRYNAWNLTGLNTFTGNLTVQTGVVYFNSIADAGVASALGAGSAITLSSSGANLVYTGATAGSTNRPISSSSSAIHNKGGGMLTLNGAITGTPFFRGTNTITVNGLISGGSLSKTDSNTVFLTNAANSFAGDVGLLAGTISVASLANNGSVSPLGTGSVINIGQNQAIESIGRLQFTGPSGGATNRTFIVLSGSNNTALAPAGGILENTVAGQTVTYSGAFRSLGTTAPAADFFGALRLEGAGNGVYSGVIGGLSGGGLQTTPTNIALTKSGAGTWELSAANIYYGTTTVSAGTLEVSGSLSGTMNVAVNAGGTLLLSGSAGSKINDNATATLGGGKVEFSSTGPASLDEQVGALTLSASSVIDFGTFAAGNTLRFADSDGAAWTAGQTLSIWNWTAGSDHLFFGSTFGDGVSTGQLAQISFYSGSGTGFAGLGGYGELGEITPIPEPGATGLLTAAALLGLLGFRERRRLLDRKRSHARP